MPLHNKDSKSGLNAAVAAEFRAEKAAHNMSNDDLARLSGITKGSVQRYLACERHIDVNVLDALALALNTTPLEIIERAQERKARESGYFVDGRSAAEVARDLAIDDDEDDVVTQFRPNQSKPSDPARKVPARKVAKKSAEKAGASEFEE